MAMPLAARAYFNPKEQGRCGRPQTEEEMNAVTYPFSHHSRTLAEKADKGKNAKAEDDDA